MLKEHRYPVPEGYGLVNGGRVRAFDLVWDGSRRQWQPVSDSLGSDRQSVDKFDAVARRISIPPRSLKDS